MKLELLFQSPGKQYVSSQINKEGNNMFRKILDAFKAKPVNMDAFEHFVVKYEAENGKEETLIY